MPVSDSTPAMLQRRWLAAATLALGTLAVFGLVQVNAGDPLFIPATAGIAAIWVAGAVLVGRGRSRLAVAPMVGRVSPIRSLALGVAAGVLTAAICLAAGVVAARIPVLSGPAEALLAHATTGTLLVLLVTLVTGVAEELFFRGALYDVLPSRYAVPGAAVLHALTTLGSGIVLLPAAALLLGAITGLLRRLTGGVLAPIVAHLAWSLIMFTALPTVLALGK